MRYRCYDVMRQFSQRLMRPWSCSDRGLGRAAVPVLYLVRVRLKLLIWYLDLNTLFIHASSHYRIASEAAHTIASIITHEALSLSTH